MRSSASAKPLLQGRRILFVVPPTRFDEGQFYQSWQLLAEEGAWLAAASDSVTSQAIGESGASVHTLDLAGIDAAEHDAIVIVEAREEAEAAVARCGRLAASAVAAGRTVGAFGRVGAELHSAGLAVIRARKSGGLARFLAELTVCISRQPHLPTEHTKPAPT